MNFVIHQLPLYRAFVIATLAYGVIWVVLPLIMAKLLKIPVEAIVIMYGKARTFNVVGYVVRIGWIPTGAFLQFKKPPSTPVWLAISAASLSGMFLASWMLLPMDEWIRESQVAYVRLWESFIHPWALGSVYLAKFADLATNSLPRAVGLLCLYSVAFSILPFPPFSVAGQAIGRTMSQSRYMGISTVGGVVGVAWAISWGIAYIKVFLVSIGTLS